MNIENMTAAQIRDAMVTLCAALTEKGVVTPDAGLTLNSGGRTSIHMQGQYDTTPFDGERYKVIFGDDCIEQAAAYIAAMPAPETAHIRTYMRKLADAVDYGHSNGIPAEYVDPARVAMKAMSDNLLGVGK